MSERAAREVAVQLRLAEARRLREKTRAVIDEGGRLRLGGGGKAGVLQPTYGGTGREDGAEPPLGDPDTSGEVLTSTAAGVRSWSPPGDLAIPAGDCHDAGTLAALLDDLFCRLATLEGLVGGFGLQSFGTSEFGG